MNEQKVDLILQAFRDGRSQKTVQLYLSDLDAFRDYLGVGTVQTALLVDLVVKHLVFHGTGIRLMNIRLFGNYQREMMLILLMALPLLQ